jgi:hypothetical protein
MQEKSGGSTSKNTSNEAAAQVPILRIQVLKWGLQASISSVTD